MPRYLSRNENLAAFQRSLEGIEALSQGEEVRVSTAAIRPAGRGLGARAPVRRSSDEFEARVTVGGGLGGGRAPARGLGTRAPASRLGGSARTSPAAKRAVIEGLAVPYSAMSTLRGPDSISGRQYRIMFMPGAFRESLRSGRAAQAAALLEHDPRQVLGRVGYRNFRLSETPRGVEFSLDVTPHPRSQQVLRETREGVLWGASIHFIDHRHTWHTTPDYEPLMVIERADFDEVSFVPDPAFPGTYLKIIG